MPTTDKREQKKARFQAALVQRRALRRFACQQCRATYIPGATSGHPGYADPRAPLHAAVALRGRSPFPEDANADFLRCLRGE